MRRAAVFALCLIPFVFLATLNSAGYRYGASDQAFYVPAVLMELDPAVFPRDAALIESQASLTLIDEVMAALVHLTGAPLPHLFFALYVVSLALLALGGWLVAARYYRGTWAAVTLLAALTLRHAIAKSGTNTLEGYFHPRQLAFALGTLALASLLRGSRPLAVGLVLAAGLLHPTTALWFGVWLGIAAAVTDRRLRLPAALAVVLGAAAAGWALTAGPLAGRLIVMDAEWLATLETKDYLFPLDWSWDVWLVNMGYIPIILWAWRRRAAAGLAFPGEGGIVAGCLALLVVFAAALPLNAMRIALVVQLQIPRVFWMLDLLATVYAVWAIAENLAAPARRARLALAAVLIASVIRGGYVITYRFPDRAIFQVGVEDDDWGRVMAWARTTDARSGWLADPIHAVHHGTSVRVAGQRDVLVEGIKDAAIGMYTREIAMRTRDRLADVGDFASLTPDTARALASRYDLHYMVTTQPLALPLVFESGALRVYRLR
jgi:hypothetical protein